jgi:hypothetical protein
LPAIEKTELSTFSLVMRVPVKIGRTVENKICQLEEKGKKIEELGTQCGQLPLEIEKVEKDFRD